MKIRKIIFSLFSTLACASASHAVDTSAQMYIGGQGGYADTNFSTTTVVGVSGPGLPPIPITSANISNHVFAGRGYAGYQWNQYVAAEAGYLAVRATRYTNINLGTLPTGYVSEYAIDLTGKLFLPMAAYIHLSPYVKLGGAYLSAKSHGGITRNGASDFGYSLHPLFGAGIGYDFTSYLIGDISYTAIPKSNSSIPAIYLIMLGITYHFSFTQAMNGNGGPNMADIAGDDP